MLKFKSSKTDTMLTGVQGRYKICKNSGKMAFLRIFPLFKSK